MKAFDIEVNGKIVDYRVGTSLNLQAVSNFFNKTYTVMSVIQAPRHVVGKLEKHGKKLFFKLATTEGISYLTQNEYVWNEQFNTLYPRKSSDFWVPHNVGSGWYEQNLFYLITDTFNGSPVKHIQKNQLTAIIDFTECIQKLNITNLRKQSGFSFWEKTVAWYEAIPVSVRKLFRIDQLYNLVEHSYKNLLRKPRHGDFAPWHIHILTNGKLGLIDGEHAMGNGVEYYDIAYFIQRVYSVLDNPNFAQKILSELKKRNYTLYKLQTVLAARAIGGFLDESLKEKPDYSLHKDFSRFVLSLLRP